MWKHILTNGLMINCYKEVEVGKGTSVTPWAWLQMIYPRFSRTKYLQKVPWVQFQEIRLCSNQTSNFCKMSTSFVVIKAASRINETGNWSQELSLKPGMVGTQTITMLLKWQRGHRYRIMSTKELQNHHIKTRLQTISLKMDVIHLKISVVTLLTNTTLELTYLAGWLLIFLSYNQLQRMKGLHFRLHSHLCHLICNMLCFYLGNLWPLILNLLMHDDDRILSSTKVMLGLWQLWCKSSKFQTLGHK